MIDFFASDSDKRSYVETIVPVTCVEFSIHMINNDGTCSLLFIAYLCFKKFIAVIRVKVTELSKGDFQPKFRFSQ